MTISIITENEFQTEFTGDDFYVRWSDEKTNRLCIVQRSTHEVFYFKNMKTPEVSYKLFKAGKPESLEHDKELAEEACKALLGNPKPGNLSKEEKNWLAVEHVHNQLASILKKGTAGLEANDLAVMFLGFEGNKVFVPTTEQLLMVHEQINTKLTHRFKSTHPNGMGEDCYVCSFLKNQHKDFMNKFNWKANNFSLHDFQIPKYFLTE